MTPESVQNVVEKILTNVIPIRYFLIIATIEKQIFRKNKYRGVFLILFTHQMKFLTI